MQQPRAKARNLRAVCAAALASLPPAAFTAGGTEAATAPKAPPPATALGIWTSTEDNGGYSAVAGQHPGMASCYLARGQQRPAQFISQAKAAGAAPYIP